MRGRPRIVKKPEAKRAIRQLTHEWAVAHDIQPGSAEMPSFSAFHRWVSGRGGAAYFQFCSTRGPLEDAEDWFDHELRQAWRNWEDMMTDLPSGREFKVLKALCFDEVENRGQWPGVGASTEAALVGKGWIEPATCETYDTVGFRATKAGHEAHEAGWNGGLR